ncbi:hypothetical protein [Cytobacillus sp.]|uniref:hypothetical protein n=1 Tax=Cytobacillus sp. TaxID=2675269 RepID=UPI00351653AE
MEKTEYLKGWLSGVNKTLIENEKDLAKKEEKRDYFMELKKIQIACIEEWLQDDTLNPKLRQNLGKDLEFLRDEINTYDRDLAQLKQFEEDMKFVKQKIEQML